MSIFRYARLPMMVVPVMTVTPPAVVIRPGRVGIAGLIGVSRLVAVSVGIRTAAGIAVVVRATVSIAAVVRAGEAQSDTDADCGIPTPAASPAHIRRRAGYRGLQGRRLCPHECREPRGRRRDRH